MNYQYSTFTVSIQDEIQFGPTHAGDALTRLGQQGWRVIHSEALVIGLFRRPAGMVFVLERPIEEAE